MSLYLVPEDNQHLFNVDEDGQVIPVILYEEGDELIHGDGHEHCDDSTCPCNANVIDSTATVQ
jgi:hypothetical protein